MRNIISLKQLIILVFIFFFLFGDFYSLKKKLESVVKHITTTVFKKVKKKGT